MATTTTDDEPREACTADGFLTLIDSWTTDEEDDEPDEIGQHLTLASRAERDNCTDVNGNPTTTTTTGGVVHLGRSLALEARTTRDAVAAVEAKRAERDARMEACDARERALTRAQAQTRADVGRFAAFARENEVKRRTATRRAEEERAANAERDARLAEMVVELRERRALSSRADGDLARVRRFEEYLTSVVRDVAGGNAFEDITDVLGRHETLRLAQDDLESSVSNANASLEAASASREEDARKHEDARLMLAASIAELRQRDEDLRRENARLKETAAYKAQHSVNFTRELAEARMSVKNLTRRCSRRCCSREPDETDDNAFAQLDFIAERVQVIRDLVVSGALKH
jgi:hypothetical protein